MGRREVEVDQRVGLHLLEDRRRPRAAPLQHVARRVVHRGDGGGVAPADHLRDDPAHAEPELPGAGLAHAVAHEVDCAALPRGALEDLAERADEARVGVEPHAANAGGASLAAALDVSRVEPDVGHRRAVERPCAELLDVGVQARRDGAHLVLGEPRNARLLGRPLHLAGARAGGMHLGDGGDKGAVHAPVTLDHVVREEAAGAELRDARRQRADSGGERPLAVAVSAVRPAPAQLVGLGVHHGVRDLLGEAPEQVLHVDGAVAETGHGEHVRRRV